MPQVKFTEKVIRRLKAPDPSGKQVLYWDAASPGFGILCSGTSNSKTYVVRGNVRGRDIRKAIERVDLISLNDARLRAKAMMLGFSDGVDPRAKQTHTGMLREALATYLHLKNNLKPRSKQGMRDTVESHLASWLDQPLFSITRDMVEKRHQDIAAEVEARDRAKAAEHAKRHLKLAERIETHWPEAAARHRARYEAAKERKPYKGHATANGVMRALRALWNFMADRIEDPPRNPVRLRKQWFKVRRRQRLVKGDDMPKFYAAVMALENPIARDYILLTLFTGLRRNEAASLRWEEDIDLRSRIIRIAETKANYDVDLPMSDFVHDLLVARRTVGKTKYVFPAANSKSGHIEDPAFAFGQIADATGLCYSIHDMRRTFVTNADRSGVSALAVKALVDHSLGTDVTAGYTILTVEDLREPAQRIADRLKKLCHADEEPHGANVTRMR
jgi:integrase